MEKKKNSMEECESILKEVNLNQVISRQMMLILENKNLMKDWQ